MSWGGVTSNSVDSTQCAYCNNDVEDLQQCKIIIIVIDLWEQQARPVCSRCAGKRNEDPFE